MISYSFSSKTRTYFGRKCVEDAIKKEQTVIGKKTLLIMTGDALKSLGYLDELITWLSCDIYQYNKISANPDVSEIRKAVTLGKENNVESVIGFGGGSAIDAAKAAAVGIASDIDVEDYLIKGLLPPENTLPIIAIPTTAGTGAELSRGAILSSREKRIKSGIRGDRIAPCVAIVDPSYTFSLPLNITMETGFDVFAHAAESYCAIKATPFSEMLSEKAIKIVGEALPRLYKKLDDYDAREMMSFASHIMGYNVRDIGNCLPHRLQYPLGVETETSHAAGLIALYPAWMKHEYDVNPQKINQTLDWLGCEKGKPDDRIKKWLEKINILKTIQDLGVNVNPQRLEKMVSESLKNDKLADITDIISTIYQESFY